VIGAAASSGFNPLSIFSILSGPFGWALKELTQAFLAVGPLKSIGAYGLGVIVLTIIIRAVLFPIFGWQLRTSRRIQAEQRLVAPQLQELRKKYKKEPQRLSQEMNALYKEHGISPFSSLTGCIPALVQMPVLIGLYTAIRNGATGLNGSDKGFLWISDVTQSAQHACCSNGNFLNALAHPALLILPLLAGAFTFAQSRMMMPPSRPDRILPADAKRRPVHARRLSPVRLSAERDPVRPRPRAVLLRRGGHRHGRRPGARVRHQDPRRDRGR